MKKSIIIIDDERLARVELANLLKEFKDVEIIGEANDADQGIQLIESLKPDLIFLDIQMPEKSGFDLLDEISSPPAVIFTTAFNEYAIKAFEFNALDYLLKPIRIDRLGKALDKAFINETVPQNETTLPPYQDYLYLKDGDKNFFVRLEDVVLFSSFGNYVKVYFNDTTILVHRSLNQIESRLKQANFFRANRYTILNLDFIKKSEITISARGNLIINLDKGYQVVFSQRKSTEFKHKWSI